jgi:hypothetical protein
MVHTRRRRRETVADTRSDTTVGIRRSDEMPEEHDVQEAHEAAELATPVEARDQRRAPVAAGWCLLIGVGSAVVGLLPWLVTGARLPLQNLWAVETRPEQMPRVLLPFNQYTVVVIIAVLVTGAAVAGLVARGLRPRLPRHGTLAVGAGVLLVQVAALVQTAVVVRAGLGERRLSSLYLAALVAVAVISVLVGVVALALAAGAAPAGTVVGASIGALAFGPWLDQLAYPFGSVSSSPLADVLLAVARWAPAVLVGLAIGWAGFRSAGRVAAAVSGLLLLWVVPALSAGLFNAGGSRVLARDPLEMVRYGAEVSVAALTTPVLVVPPLGVAVVVAAVVIFVRQLRRRDRPAT